MILVVPVSQTDDEVLEDFVRVFNLFGPYPGHDLVVVSRPRDHILARETYRRIEHNFERGCKIHHTFDIDGRLGWPGGPNHYWLETAKYLKGDEYTNTDKPWLFLEMDTTPLCRGWADKLEAEVMRLKLSANAEPKTAVTDATCSSDPGAPDDSAQLKLQLDAVLQE